MDIKLLSEIVNDDSLMGITAAFIEEKKGNPVKAEEHLKSALLKIENKTEIYSSLIRLFENSNRNGSELNRLYWELARYSYLFGNKNETNKCLSYFSRLLSENKNINNIARLFPEDKFDRDEPDEKYIKKERNLIPNSFQFRYTHHDYTLLSAYGLKLGGAVLHLGCNMGLNSIILARNGCFVHGVDIQQEAIKKAAEFRSCEIPEIARRVSFQCSSFTSMSLPDGYFDSVIAFDVFEHIYSDDLDSILQKITTALKPGGYAIFHFPLGESFYDPAHVNLFDMGKARLVFAKWFDIEKIYVTVENDKVNKRINLIACNSKVKVLEKETPYTKYKDPDSFTSGFFTEYYTKQKVVNVISRMYQAAQNPTPFSMVRIGDVESRFLAYKKVDLGYLPPEDEAELIEANLGINPARLSDFDLHNTQSEFMNALLEADILGSHRQTVNTKWHQDICKVFNAYNKKTDYLANEFDVVINSELLDQGYLLPLLNNRKILLIGNAAPKFADLLFSEEYRNKYIIIGMPQTAPDIAGAIYIPHNGSEAFNNLEIFWKEVQSYDFDIAIIAASLTGKLLAGRIKRELGRAALDIGWCLQYLADSSSPVAPARDEAYISGRRGFSNLFKGRTK